jgi:hypothetical protein
MATSPVSQTIYKLCIFWVTTILKPQPATKLHLYNLMVSASMGYAYGGLDVSTRDEENLNIVFFHDKWVKLLIMIFISINKLLIEISMRLVTEVSTGGTPSHEYCIQTFKLYNPLFLFVFFYNQQFIFGKILH